MRELLRVLVLIAALLIAAIGTLLGAIGIALGFLSGGPDMTMMVTVGVSLSTLSLGFGSASALHAWRAVQGHSSTAFRPRMPWLLLVLFLFALVLGQLVLSYSLLPALVFPPFHVAASVLPPLLILAVVGHALPGVTTWRHAVLQVSGGAFLAAPLAMLLEIAAILFLATAAVTSLTLQPNGQELLITVTSYIEEGILFQAPTELASLLLTPVALAAVGAVVAGLIPLIEEAVKAIGVGLMANRRLSLPQSLVWGLAAGAGFSVAEGLLNSAGALEAWLPTVLLRLGATLLHCLTGAMMGLAWYQLVGRRQWAQALGLYLASVVLHGLWNGLAAVIAFLSVTAVGSGLDGDNHLALTLGTLTAFPLLALLALGMVGGLAALAVYARRRIPTAGAPSGEHAQQAAPHSATGESPRIEA